MYQCVSFYSANRVLDPHVDAVIAAWCVTADSYYYYHMQDDNMGFPDAFCFIRTIRGQGKIRTKAGEEVLLSENDYLLIHRKEIRYYASNATVWAYYWVDFLCSAPLPVPLQQKQTVLFEKREEELFQELLQAGLRYPDKIRYINSIFLHYFYALVLKAPSQEAARSPVLIEEICSYINQKLYSKLTVQDIADFFQISPRRVHQIFRQHLQIPPKQYISTLKIEKAKAILSATATPIHDLAALLGYDSAYHFSTAFKNATGCPPSEYRRQEQEKNGSESASKE